MIQQRIKIHSTVSHLFVLLVLCVMTGLVFAESESSGEFIKEIHGVGGLLAATQMSDGSYLTASGLDFTADTTTITINKLSSSGRPIWKKSFQVSSPYNYSTVYDFIELQNGYLVLGVGRNNKTPQSGFLIKLDTSGKILWTRVSQSLWFYSASEQPGGTFFILAMNTSSYYTPTLMKFSVDGEVLWTRAFPAIPNSPFFPIIRSAAGPNHELVFLYHGDYSPWYPHAVYLLKINEKGNVAWNLKLKTDGFQADSFNISANGDLLLLDIYNKGLISLNSGGRLLWASTFPINSGNPVPFKRAIQTPDKGYALVGTHDGNAILLKLDSKRNLDFQRKFMQQESEEIGYIINSTAEGGYSLFTTNADWDKLQIIRMDSEGSVSGCEFSRPAHFFEQGAQRPLSVKISKVPVPTLPAPAFTLDELDISLVKTSESLTPICE